MKSLLHYPTLLVQKLYAPQKKVTVAILNEILDDLVTCLNNTRNQTDGLCILTSISYELSLTNTLRLFDNEHIMHHRFFTILARTLDMLLTKATFITMTKEDENCFDEISNLIVNLCLYRKNPLLASYTNDNDNDNLEFQSEISTEKMSYEKLFVTDKFLAKLSRILSDDLAVHEYKSFHVKYKVIGRLLYLCTELNHINHGELLDSVVRCLNTTFYLDVYETIDLRKPTANPKELFFIYRCPQFICFRSYQRQEEIADKLCPLILAYCKKILELHLPIVLDNEVVESKTNHKKNILKIESTLKFQAIGWHFQLLNYFALTPITRMQFITGIYETIVDQMINILHTKSLIRSAHQYAGLFDVDVNLISWTLTLLYNLSFEENILSLFKEKNLGQYCLPMHKAQERAIQLTSQTLSTILNQNTIDEIKNPSSMVENYLLYIENSMQQSSLIYQGIKLDNLLTYLEIITQNDDIKNGIGHDDDGISLLTQCILNQHLDIETIQYLALRIIEAVSFGDEHTCKNMNNNEKLMNHITNLSLSNEPTLQSIANRIRWKLQEEKSFLSKLTDKQIIQKQCETSMNNYDGKTSSEQQVTFNYNWDLCDNRTSDKFDLMISYHESDKEICRQIYERLISSSFYRISFDDKHADEIQPSTMAERIENSSIILMCFSSKYQSSYACRMAAEYAEKRQRSIIPVKLDESYCPTGWLNNIIVNKHCINVIQYSVNSTCASLIQKIDDIKRNGHMT